MLSFLYLISVSESYLLLEFDHDIVPGSELPFIGFYLLVDIRLSIVLQLLVVYAG